MHGDAMDTDTPNHPDDDDYDDIKVIAKNNGACVEPRDIAPGWIHIDFRVGNGWTSCPTGW